MEHQLGVSDFDAVCPGHEVHQGLRRYEDLEGHDELKARVLNLRGEGQTGEQIAEVLNREGFRAPRGGEFTGHRVRRMFMLFGLTGVPAGVRGQEGMPGKQEWWLPDLAAELDVKPIVVHRWRWSGRLIARQLAGDSGRWVVWADRAEVRRLRMLRRHEVDNPRQPVPAELATPKKAAKER